MDERFVHQLPEPLPNVATPHPHWRESYFFVLHERAGAGDRDGAGDVPILAMAHYPARGMLDALVMGRWGGQAGLRRYDRPYGDDPHTTVVDKVAVEIVEPFRTVRLTGDDAENGFAMDLTFTARTRAYGLRRGRLMEGTEVLWDQSHMIQSGTYAGTYTANGQTVEVVDWWGQRDHSWGIRNHGRIPLWMWFALQFDDGMLGLWKWETADGAPIFLDGCWAPAGDGEPVPVVALNHDLTWIDGDGKQTEWGADGASVTGLRGEVQVWLANGDEIAFDATGTWCAPYKPFYGGGQHLMRASAFDGRTGNGIFEITGGHHHRFFPTDIRRA
jgi:hypothetical protein